MIQKPQSRREREDEQRRQDILSVAEQLFSRMGYHQTSVADIAKNAEMGVGTVYKYFQDKDTLFHELMQARMKETMLTMLHAIEEDGNPYEVINRFIDTFMDQVAKYPNFFPIYMSQLHYRESGPERFRESIEHLHEGKLKLMHKLVEVFDRGAEQGVFVKVSSMSLVVALFGMVMSHFLLATSGMLKPEDLDIDEIKQTVKTIFFHKVLVDESTRYEEQLA